jgi:diaminopimelate decarboxylase
MVVEDSTTNIKEMETSIMSKHFPFTLDQLKHITSDFPTPFYLYDEKAIRANIRRLYQEFSWNPGFREYFAVKSTPNPYILNIFKEEGCGVDCASETELILANACSFTKEDIMFTSNVTTAQEFIRAKSLDAIINLDDISHIEFLKQCAGIPELICFRLNPGGTIQYQDQLMIDFHQSKFGFTKDQFVNGIKTLQTSGVHGFGIHFQFGSHRRETEYFGENARQFFHTVVDLCQRTGIRFEFINLAGGIGIPYQEDQKEADLEAISQAIKKAYDDILVPAGLTPMPLYFELGIFMTGPYGYFVSSVLHEKKTYKTYLGLDASTNSFMSPSRYTNYHHITVVGKEASESSCIYDVTGALCENRDKFAQDRYLPPVQVGDFLVFHDAGAYTYSHSNQFNGKLRPAELLLREDGTMKQIRRAETPTDYFATLDYPITTT